MRPKTILCILLCLSIVNGYSQAEKILQEALNFYSTVNSYSCICQNTFVNNTSNISYECEIEVTRNPIDSVCGFYYFFNYKPQKNVEDFYMYNGIAHYMSFKGKVKKTSFIDKPKQFEDKHINDPKMGEGVMPALPKRPLIHGWTLFEIEKSIQKDLKNKSLELIFDNDTLIDSIPCYHFKFKWKGSKSVKEVFLEKNTLYPKYLRNSFYNDFGQETNSVIFNNLRTDISIPLSYYAEENLLPSNWQENLFESKTIDLTGKIAPEWILPVLGEEDKVLNFKTLKSKIILLEFTATWCAHCIRAVEVMNKLNDTLIYNDDVVLISLFSSEIDKLESIQKFAKLCNISNTTLYNATETGKKYEVYGYPTFFVIDKDGIIKKHHVGLSEDMDKKLYDDIMELVDL